MAKVVTADKIIEIQAKICLRKMGTRRGIWSLDDLISEGNIVLHRVRVTWNPSGKATFNTYLNTCLIRQFHNILRKAMLRSVQALPDVGPVVTALTCSDVPVRISRDGRDVALFFRHDTGTLSDRAEAFLQCALDPPPELQAICRDTSNKRKTFPVLVAQYLGLSRWKLQRVRRELVDATI